MTPPTWIGDRVCSFHQWPLENLLERIGLSFYCDRGLPLLYQTTYKQLLESHNSPAISPNCPCGQNANLRHTTIEIAHHDVCIGWWKWREGGKKIEYRNCKHLVLSFSTPWCNTTPTKRPELPLCLCFVCFKGYSHWYGLLSWGEAGPRESQRTSLDVSATSTYFCHMISHISTHNK